MSRPAGSAASSARPAPSSSTRDDSDDDDSQPAKAAGPYRTDPKADALVKEAEKKQKSFSISFLSGNTKYEEAIELLEKAASIYKMNKNWQEAGQVYVQCAELNQTKLKSDHEAGQHYEHAAKAFKNVNSKEALRCYQAAVDILMENNKFAMAAKIWKEMGTISEKEHNTAAAMEQYQKAADCYEADNAAANANGMFIKVADLAADSEEYKRAIGIYEKVSRGSVENSALRWSVKDYLFKALLCHLVLHAPSHHLDAVSDKLSAYVDLCPHLDNTREKALIEELIADFDAQDPDAFADHVFRFDEVMPLDRWKSKVLLQVKQALEGGNPDGNEVGV